MISAALLLTVLAAATEGESSAGARRYAIIIGVNDAFSAGQKPLSYADDDAVRFYSLFRELAGEAALFTLLDAETQGLYPEVVGEAEIPEKEAIFARAERMFAQIAADKARGISTELYLIYSGHGLVDERGEGRLGLRGGTFSRTELYERFLAKSPPLAIVDAATPFSGGGNDPNGPGLAARAREFLDRQTLARFPTTGAILSTASMAESHEWSEIKGGVFSHQVRSAILGAADADEDGRISYDELEAFVLSANLGVKHQSANRAVFVRAPERDRAHPVIELSALARAHRLRVGPEQAGRIAIADDQGRRYLDLNKAPGFSLVLALLPGLRYFVSRGDADFLVPGEGKESDLGLLATVAPTLRARGSGIADAYEKGLFSVAFGPQLVDGFRLGVRASADPVLVVDESHPLRTASLITGGAALALGGVAVGFWVAGDGATNSYNQTLRTGSLLEQAIRPGTTAPTSRWAAVGLGVTALGLLGLDLLDVRF
jgi:hypothetical protein